MNKLIKVSVWMVLITFFFILGTNIWVVQSTKELIYDIEDTPTNQVALVLGTSKQTAKGQPNRFFMERMITTANLYEKNKVKHILVSGDNRTKYYNEPLDMFLTLRDLNIPEKDISLDLEGFRTLHSIERCREVFNQTQVTIVTQKFHCYRSLFIAKHFDMDAVAVSASNGGSIGKYLALREVFARTMAVLDLYVFHRSALERK